MNGAQGQDEAVKVIVVVLVLVAGAAITFVCSVDR